MAYYLMVEKKRGDYLYLNIQESKYFISDSKHNGAARELKEIDNFTMTFNNETELREDLLQEGILPLELYNKSLSLRKKNGENYKKVMYDFLYRKDYIYVADEKELIKRIDNKLESYDFKFVCDIATNYIRYYDCSSTAAEVRNYALDSMRLGTKSKYFDCLDDNYDNPLVRMIKLLIYKYYQYPNGRVEYNTNQIKYRNLHSLIAFTNNYDKKQLLENGVMNSKPKIKVRKKEVDGQLSFFDIEE